MCTGGGVPWPDATGPVESVGFTREMTKCGTVTAAAAITTAAPAATPTCASLRLRARFLIRSKVPGFGSNGFTRSLSQTSMSSRWSSMGFPNDRAEPGPCVM